MGEKKTEMLQNKATKESVYDSKRTPKNGSTRMAIVDLSGIRQGMVEEIRNTASKYGNEQQMVRRDGTNKHTEMLSIFMKKKC